MEGIPFGFILIILGLFFVSVVVTMTVIFCKQRRLQRLKDPHRDYIRHRSAAR